MSKDRTATVVIVEDDYLVSQELSFVLKEAGYKQVGKASDGLEGVELVCLLRPDVVLMDIDLPEIDGLEAATRIQGRCPTPVVVMTAYDSRDLVDKASDAGVGAYLTKPPKADEIERAVTIAVARHNDMMECRNLTEDRYKDLKQKIEEKESLRASLKDNKMLVKEVYHRVKNNLLILQSMLRLQSDDTESSETGLLLKDIENRLVSMSMIHGQLYMTEDMKSIKLSGYVQSLVKNLYHSYVPSGEKIATNVTVPDINIDVDLIVSLGLILNELVSNAFKYAFKKVDGGVLTVSLEESGDGQLSLIVRDNGVGLPEGLDIYNTTSLGMQLITSLVSQIDGVLDISREEGTEFRISFKRADT